MVLFWFLLGIALILCIARYNESNKLFWSLFIAYIGAFTTASIVLALNNHEPKKVNLTQVCPTQPYTNDYNTYALMNNMFCNTTNEHTRSVTVSKDYIPAPRKIYNTLHTLRTDNNLKILSNFKYYDTS